MSHQVDPEPEEGQAGLTGRNCGSSWCVVEQIDFKTNFWDELVSRWEKTLKLSPAEAADIKVKHSDMEQLETIIAGAQLQPFWVKNNIIRQEGRQTGGVLWAFGAATVGLRPVYC